MTQQQPPTPLQQYPLARLFARRQSPEERQQAAEVREALSRLNRKYSKQVKI